MGASDEALRELATAIREACHPRAWSRGVVLVREEAVEGREETEDELVLAVAVAERPVPFTVVLYPETVEWDCDCFVAADACPHVAAAIIAVQQARRGGTGLPARKKSGAYLRYRFVRDTSGAVPRLWLERLLVAPDGSTSILAGSAARHAALGNDGPRLRLDEVDLRVERLIQTGRVEVDRPEQVTLLLADLVDVSELWLDDAPIRLSRDALSPRGRIEGNANELFLVIEADPSLQALLTAGLALVAAKDGTLTLRPLGDVSLTGPRLEKLPVRRRFGKEDFAELAAEVLPIFRGRFEVEVANPHVPKLGGPEAPRIDFNVEHHAESVAVSPEVVYGRPPRLRIEDRRAIYLGGTVPERDHRAERDLVTSLRDILNLMPGRRVEVRGAESQEFLRRVRDFARVNAEHDEVLAMPRLVPRVTIDGDRFQLELETEGGEGPPRRADPKQAMRAFEDGHELVPLLGGGWGELPREWLTANHDRIALLLELSGNGGALPACALPTLARLCAELDQPPPPGIDRLAPLISGFEGLPRAELPKGLQADLRPYQRAGVDWLCFLRDAGLGALLADDMGLGKTLQALCAIRGRTLIVCPTSVLPNWANEAARFRPDLTVSVFHGPNRVLDPKADLTLTTYALMRLDVERLRAVGWDTVVLDEAQAIKNAESQTAQAAFSIPATFRLALTGTPVENRLEELWSQMRFTNPGLLYGRSDFVARFSKPIGEGDANAARNLRERIRPFLLRRLKRDVAKDLPPRTDMVLYSELNAEEREAYGAVWLATRRDVVEQLDTGRGVMAALEALLRLRQACCHRGLLPGHEAAEASSKLETLMESVTEVVAEGHKALVFSQWTSLLDRVEPVMNAAEVPFVRLDGSTKDRGEVVARFQSDDGPPVMLVSLKAGGTGLNLTAADHVFLLDPWWNPAVEDQAADRTHRIGQTRPVMVYRLVARDTVEERILALQSKKRAIADVALGEAAAAAALTRDDLLALFE